jgi:hypothetical protein
MSRRRKNSPKPKAAAGTGGPTPGTPPRESHESVGPVSTPADRWVRWLVPVLTALFTLAAFLPALQNQFVNWDDDKNLLDNPHYRGLGWTQLHWMWTTHLGHWIPLTWMTFGLDYLLWGMKPFGYHLSSLLLHAANAVVFYFVAHRILGLARPGPVERGHAGSPFLQRLPLSSSPFIPCASNPSRGSPNGGTCSRGSSTC